MRVYDISRELSPQTLVYPGDPPVELSDFLTIGDDSAFNISRLILTTHTMTHVDAPLHFIKGGQTLNDLPLSRFMGETLVVEVSGDAVNPGDIPSGEIKGINLLFKTRNSSRWDPDKYLEDYVYVSAEAASTARERGVNLLGIDYLSIDRFDDESYPVHNILLSVGVLIMEGLDLSQVPAGKYVLYAFPLKIAHADGSPVRAILVAQD